MSLKVEISKCIQSLKVLIFCLFAQNQPIHERDSVTIDLFGRWQTEKYKPPPAKDVRSLKNKCLWHLEKEICAFKMKYLCESFWLSGKSTKE